MSTTELEIQADRMTAQPAGSAPMVAPPGATSVQRMNGEAGRSDPFTAMIERVITDPSVSVEKLERVLLLRNEEIERERKRDREDAAFAAQRAFYAAMSECQKELPVVIKNKKNDHSKSTYADLAAIEEQAMPVIYDHGFAVMFQPAGYNQAGELLIKWRITHRDGHSESDIAGIPVDGAGAKGGINKTGTQAFGSTATYGRRYLLCMLFNISTGDDRDGNAIVTDANGQDKDSPINPDQLKELWDMIDRVGANAAKFCQIYNLQAVPDLPVRKFTHAMNELRDYGERKRLEQGGVR